MCLTATPNKRLNGCIPQGDTPVTHARAHKMPNQSHTHIHTETQGV